MIKQLDKERIPNRFFKKEKIGENVVITNRRRTKVIQNRRGY